jgi:hypothetical protein
MLPVWFVGMRSGLGIAASYYVARKALPLLEKSKGKAQILPYH